MICLADNDIVLKLSAFDLLQQGLAVIGGPGSDVHVLRTLIYILAGKRQALSAQWTIAGYNRAYAFAEQAKTLPGSPDQAHLATLTAVDAIDNGEALLFECACRNLDAIVATGDKKSLRALANATTCQSIYGSLNGRVICFEQVLLRLIRQYGYVLVRNSVCPVLQADGLLQQAFNRGPQTPEADVVKGLRESMASMWQAVGPLLVST